MAIGLSVDAAARGLGLDLGLGADLDLETPQLLPRAAVDTLLRLADDADTLRDVVAAAARTLLTQDPTGDEDGGPPPTVGLTEAIAVAACLLARAARDMSEPAAPMRQVLVDCGVADERLLAQLVPLLETHIASIRAELRATSFDFAHVVDVTWRLDYILRSSAAGNVHELVYFVQLKVQPPQGAVRDVAFSCSVEGLRDLVYRLQDATNAIEKIAAPLIASKHLRV